MLRAFYENAGGIVHQLHALVRVVFRVPRTRYFEKLAQQTDRIRVLLDENGDPRCCITCGYVKALLAFDNGWEMEACTRVGFKGIVNSKVIDSWVEAMPELGSTPTKTEMCVDGSRQNT